MKIRVYRDTSLIKGLNKTKLVLVDVEVQGKKGPYKSKRWKNPNVALNIVKRAIYNKTNKDRNIHFKSKKTGNFDTEKKIIKKYLKSNKKTSLQNFIAKYYTINFTKKYAEFKGVKAEQFRNILIETKKTNDPTVRWRVDVHQVENYEKTRNYTQKNGSTFAITGDGDIISVCKNENDINARGKDIMEEAVRRGGKKLDSFSGNHSFYQQCGFEPISWCDFDEEFAPPDWDPKTCKKEPIIFYMYTGNKINRKEVETAEEFFSRVKKSKDYDAAQKVREDKLKEYENEE